MSRGFLEKFEFKRHFYRCARENAIHKGWVLKSPPLCAHLYIFELFLTLYSRFHSLYVNMYQLYVLCISPFLNMYGDFLMLWASENAFQNSTAIHIKFIFASKMRTFMCGEPFTGHFSFFLFFVVYCGGKLRT